MPSLRFVFVGLIGAIAILPGAYAEEHKNYGAELEASITRMRSIVSSSPRRGMKYSLSHRIGRVDLDQLLVDLAESLAASTWAPARRRSTQEQRQGVSLHRRR